MEGTERYLKLKEIKKAASLLADKDFCYQEFWVWDDSILEFISAPPFFGDKKICVLYFFPEDDRLLKTSIWEGTDIYILTENMVCWVMPSFTNSTRFLLTSNHLAAVSPLRTVL